MKYQFDKNVKIVNEIISFCHRYGVTKFDVHFETTKDFSKHILIAYADFLPPTLPERVKASLDIQRQPEVETNYWDLSGFSSSGDELSLVGMMIDESEVTYEDGMLKIVVIRDETV